MRQKIAKPELIQRVRAILARQFPGARLNVGPGFYDNIHVLITADSFREMTDRQRHETVWAALDESDLTEEEKVRISMIFSLAPGEAKVSR